MTQLGCPEGATTAYALAYSKDRDQEFLQEKEVCLGSGYILYMLDITFLSAFS